MTAPNPNTPLAIISDAYFDAGLIQEGQTPNSEQIVSGMRKLTDIINLSINQTLGRTILTTLATMLVVVALYIWGGEVLNTFSFTILVGFFSGMYSTIFVVSPIVIWWNKLQKTSW